MKAEELRIGNYISCNGNEITVELPELNLIHNRNSRNKYTPISLTEEWLLKFGFNIDYKKGYIGIDVNHTDFVLTYPKIMGEWQNHFAFEFQAGGWPRYVQLKYVHQLQNLYFALTGEELK